MSHDPEHASEEDLERLFVHKHRPDWGVGLLIAEGPTKRRIRFQDGVLRAFKRGWYHMLEPYAASTAAATTVLEELEEQHETLSDEKERLERQAAATPDVSFSEQVAIFEHLYPEGFRDPTWLDAIRHPVDGQRRKRHVEPVIQAAREHLDRARVDTMLAEGRATELLENLVELLGSTSLASPSTVVKPLAGLAPEHHEPLMRSMRELLYGDAKHRERLRDWILTLDQTGLKLGWPMVSLIPALVSPDLHVCVKRSAFREQCRSLAPDAVIRRHPTPRAYRRARKLAKEVRERLVAAGHQPADLFDVRGFVWETLRPRGKAVLDEIGKGAA